MNVVICVKLLLIFVTDSTEYQSVMCIVECYR